MRRVAIAVVLVLACALDPRASAPPLQVCRSAFPDASAGSDAGGWVLVPVLLPLVWIFGPERVVGWIGSGSEPLARRYSQRQLRLLHRAAQQGHLPSQYLLARQSRDVHTQWSEPGEPPLEGVLSDGEVRQSFWELASVGFPLGEIEVADEAADAGFEQRAVGSLSREQVEYFRASQRWQFFELATRAALRGSRGAWESLERRYADLIDRFESRSEDRAQGYAWTYLATLPVYDIDRSPNDSARREERRRAAWGRLRDDAERDRARELARRYETDVFPRVIHWSSERELCAVEPQFGGGAVELSGLYNPIRLPPAYGAHPSVVSPAPPAP